MRVQEIARLGLLRTFQTTRIYGKMDCMQNMLISIPHRKAGFLDMFAHERGEVAERAEHLLAFVGLYEKRFLRAGRLSFGQQKLLEFAMALMNEPTVLLLDEPTAGINPTLINGLLDRLSGPIREFGITLFIIEHNMRVIMNTASKIYCMAHGELLAEGEPGEIQRDQRVIDAYLGATLMAGLRTGRRAAIMAASRRPFRSKKSRARREAIAQDVGVEELDALVGGDPASAHRRSARRLRADGNPARAQSARRP